MSISQHQISAALLSFVASSGCHSQNSLRLPLDMKISSTVWKSCWYCCFALHFMCNVQILMHLLFHFAVGIWHRVVGAPDKGHNSLPWRGDCQFTPLPEGRPSHEETKTEPRTCVSDLASKGWTLPVVTESLGPVWPNRPKGSPLLSSYQRTEKLHKRSNQL